MRPWRRARWSSYAAAVGAVLWLQAGSGAGADEPARIELARVELARLTVSEYRNAVADLVGSFGVGASPSQHLSAVAQHGLQGEYFASTGRRSREALFTRLDPNVRFDFGPSSPDFDKITTSPFSVTWRGAVLPADTGQYEFVVRTEHSTRLWVNDITRPLIDASVKSGNDTEFRGSIFLLGGRAYPLRLELSRGTLGVRKEAKEKPPPVKTTIALEWKPPLGPAHVIPQRHLRAGDAAVVFAPATPFPADDRSFGYERGTAISKAWVQAVVDGAIETASYVVANLDELSGVAKDASDRPARLRDFCVAFAERGFRRPLTPEQTRLYVDRQFETAKEPEAAVRRVVLLVLQSPRFLYREPGRTSDGSAARRDAFDTASRMSFALWDSIPDDNLTKAAAAGRLETRHDVVREARRMLADRRARTKLRGFLWHWLKLDQVSEITKDAKRFPGFDAAVVSDLRTSLDLFLEETVWSEASDFRELLVADYLYLNERLAPLYGGSPAADDGFRKVVLQPKQRAGVLTHPYVMASYAYASTSSPIHRGVFVARELLGVSLRPPPDAFAPLAPELHPNLTTRERIALQTGPRECRSCHTVINQLGFTLEHFDAIGRFRDRENGRPIDATATYASRSGAKVELAEARDLARFLAKSDEAHEAFVARLFHYLVKQPIGAFGPNKLAELRGFFADHEFSVRRLAIEIVAQTALAGREPGRHPGREPGPAEKGARSADKGVRLP